MLSTEIIQIFMPKNKYRFIFMASILKLYNFKNLNLKSSNIQNQQTWNINLKLFNFERFQF